MPEPRGRAGGLALLQKYGRGYFSELGKRGAAARKQTAVANVMAVLTLLASTVAQRARDNVRSQRIPQDIADAISVGKAQVDQSGNIHIDVIVDMGNPDWIGEARKGRMAARAYEYGSGLHATKDMGAGAGKYIIRPREKPWLAFPFTLTFPPRPGKLVGVVTKRTRNWWDYKQVVWYFSKFGGEKLEGDPMFWNYVEHPGVEPKPYLRPAIESVKGEMKSQLGKAFARSFIDESFTVEVKI